MGSLRTTFNRATFDASIVQQGSEASGKTSIFGGVFLVSKSLLGIEGQKKLKKTFVLNFVVKASEPR